jgi:hypothetical protein
VFWCDTFLLLITSHRPSHAKMTSVRPSS